MSYREEDKILLVMTAMTLPLQQRAYVLYMDVDELHCFHTLRLENNANDVYVYKTSCLSRPPEFQGHYRIMQNSRRSDIIQI